MTTALIIFTGGGLGALVHFALSRAINGLMLVLADVALLYPAGQR